MIALFLKSIPLYRSALSFVCIASLVLATGSKTNADLVQGDLLGVFSGNDSEAAILAELGIEVSLLAKVNTPAVSSDGLTIFSLILNDDDDAISGEWSYSGLQQVDLFVVKGGPDYAVYQYTDTNTNNMRNMGIWDNGDLPNAGMSGAPPALSHVTAYTFAVPEPASTMLLGVSFVCAGLRRRRK